MDDLVKRVVVRAGRCGHHYDEACLGCRSANVWTDDELDAQRDRIEALEAQLARIREPDEAMTSKDYALRVAIVMMEAAFADPDKLKTSEQAMNAWCDAMETIRAALAATAPE